MTSARYALFGGNGTVLTSLTESSYTLRFYSRGTQSPQDDAYVRDDAPRAPGSDSVLFIDLNSGNDGLGTLRRTFHNGNAQVSAKAMEVYDDIAAAAGGLDYIQLGRFSDGLTAGTGGYSYFALTTPEIAPIPTVGSATYAGETRGRVFGSSSGDYNDRGDVRASVSFSLRTLDGTASNFRGVNDNGVPVSVATGDNGFDFSGRVNDDRTLTGQVFGRTPGAVGSFRGKFAGSDAASAQPAEMALSYEIGGMIGVAGLKRTGGVP